MEPMLRLFSPTIRFPSWGDTNWDYRPLTEGAPLLGFRTSTTAQEREVFSEVPIGKQLGRIMDVVAGLAAIVAKDQPDRLGESVEFEKGRTLQEAIDRLSEIHGVIHEIKVRTTDEAIKEAKANLRTLKNHLDKKSFQDLVKEIEKNLS